jgi:hypothetical protein
MCLRRRYRGKFNIASRKIEQVKSDGTFYEEGEEKDRMWKGTEWVEEFAIPRLREVSILQDKIEG